MKTIKVTNGYEIPRNFTGVAEFPSGNKFWYKEGKIHREDGPACEFADGSKEWWVNGKLHREDGPAIESPIGYMWYLKHEVFFQINLDNYLVLDYSEGPCGLMWYKLLDKDQILEYPDIPGLITK